MPMAEGEIDPVQELVAQNQRLREQVSELKEELREQGDELRFYHALQAAGVDNWEGYSHAWQIYREMGDDE